MIDVAKSRAALRMTVRMRCLLKAARIAYAWRR